MEAVQMPPYKGATLRGAFGFALKKVACIRQDAFCEQCAFPNQCPYSYLFETPVSEDPAYGGEPHPFVLEPPLDNTRTYPRGAPFVFDAVLIGRGLEFLPHFVLALRELGLSGLGKGKGRVSLNRCFCIGNDPERNEPFLSDIYDGQTGVFQNHLSPRSFDPHVTAEAASLPKGALLKLHFLTPTRITLQDRLTMNIDFELLMRTLLRRVSVLAVRHCGQKLSVDCNELILRARDQVRVVESQLFWEELERYSMRQERRVKIGGFRGEILFEGNFSEFLPYLMLGKYLHVGKGTTFGLGKYNLEMVS